MIYSVIIPLIKNKCSDQTDNIYRPIALSSIISKVFEHIIAERLEVYIYGQTTINLVLNQVIQLIFVFTP